MSSFEQLIIPINTEKHPAADGVSLALTTVALSDGSRFTQADSGDDRYIVVSGPEGVIPSPDTGRYPFSERIARMALEHFDATGHLPSGL